MSLRLSTLTQEFGQTSFADCISTLSSGLLFLWHRAKEKRGSFGQAITSSSLGFVQAQGTESAFTVPITKPLSSCPPLIPFTSNLLQISQSVQRNNLNENLSWPQVSLYCYCCRRKTHEGSGAASSHQDSAYPLIPGLASQ